VAAVWLKLELSIMAQSRVQSLKDEEAYKALIKAHLEDPRKTTKHWNSSDLDFVVGHYVQFLCGVALTGCSINETMLTKCMRDMFPGAQECKDLAKKLAEALSHCRYKAKPSRMSSGSKLSAAVMQVIAAMRTGSGEIEESPTPSTVASPAPSTPPRSDGDASRALKMLQEAFGEEATMPISATAAPSKGQAISLDDSPVSVASSFTELFANSPPPVTSAPSSSIDAPLQVFCKGSSLDVQGFACISR
jgi:hypothetical protein